MIRRVPRPAASDRHPAPGSGSPVRPRRGRPRAAVRPRFPAHRARHQPPRRSVDIDRRRLDMCRNDWQDDRSSQDARTFRSARHAGKIPGSASAYRHEIYVAASPAQRRRRSYAPQSNFSAVRAFRCLGLPEPRCYPAPASHASRPQPAHSRALHHHQASHFRRIFIMTQVDHSRMANAIRGARHGCRREGEIRPSGPADGRGRHRHRAVHAVPEIRRRRSEMAGPRPLRALGRPRLDAALCAALSDRQCRT